MNFSAPHPLAKNCAQHLDKLRLDGFCLSLDEMRQAATQAEAMLGGFRGAARMEALFYFAEGERGPDAPAPKDFEEISDHPFTKSVKVSLGVQGWEVGQSWFVGRPGPAVEFASCLPARLFAQLIGQDGQSHAEREVARASFADMIDKKLFSIDRPLPGLESLHDNDALTALGRCCLLSSPALIASMLALGADPNAPSAFGLVPLGQCLWAPMSGAEDCVQTLLNAGADPRIPAPDGSPLWRGFERGPNNEAALLLRAAAQALDEADALAHVARAGCPKSPQARI